jgi:hypothetical protein
MTVKTAKKHANEFSIMNANLNYLAYKLAGSNFAPAKLKEKSTMEYITDRTLYILANGLFLVFFAAAVSLWPESKDRE